MLARLADGDLSRGRAPRGLVLAPTRELAMQVTDVLTPLARSAGQAVALVAGGMSYTPQQRAFERGVDVVVATPGRLIDLMDQGVVDLGRVELTVLDEADHMADLGFMPAVTQILDAVPDTGQRLLFSATLDEAVDQLVRRYLNDPATVSVDAATASVATMAHLVVPVAPADKTRVTAEPRWTTGLGPSCSSHPAGGRPGRGAAARRRGDGGRASRRSATGGANPDPGCLPGRVLADSGRDRCRSPGDPRGRRRPGAAGGPAARQQGVPAPGRPHGPRRGYRPGHHPRAAAPAADVRRLLDRAGVRGVDSAAPDDSRLSNATRPKADPVSDADYQRLIAPPVARRPAAKRSRHYDKRR